MIVAHASGAPRAPARPATAWATCDLCPHACRLATGERGRCRARAKRNGRVEPDNYGRITSLALDPIEKKPLARFHPGASVLSVGSFGCNMRCSFCQNASIAPAGADDVAWRAMSAEEVVARALALRGQGCIGVAYTYNEPLVGIEFVLDTARCAREAGLVNVLVSNGMVSARRLEGLLGLLDAANIDLKCFTDEGYRSLGGSLSCVRQTIETLAAEASCHLEVTTLVVAGLNDSADQIAAMARWLSSLDPQMTYHLTRCFPRYRMADSRPTDKALLAFLADIAREHLDDVVVGNL